MGNYCSNNDKRKIVFFCRKGVLAKGDYALYYSIASQIAKDDRYDVYCINNANKEMQESYLDSGINFCDITDDNIHTFEGATFITAFNQLFFLMEELEKLNDAKILLLFLHPQIYNWMAGQVSKKFDFDSLFKLMIQNKSVAFMDKGNLLAVQKHSKHQFEPKYFPVVADREYEDKYTKIVDDKYYNIVWFGRLDGDKVHSLINFLDNVMDFDFGKPLTIHLVGDGRAKIVINFEKYAPKMRFIINSYIFGEDKDRYLKENADMVIGMGISALDGALLKIPTVLTLVVPSSFKENKFTLYCDTKDYCLGVASGDIKATGIKTYLAHEIVEMCCGEKGKEIGEKCYECAINSVHVKNQISNILQVIEEASMMLSDLRENKSVKKHFARFTFYRKVRGERNYNDYLIFRKKLKKWFGKHK